MATLLDPRLPLKDKRAFSNQSQSKGKLISEPQASKNTGNPFEWLTNENIGRRTGRDIVGSKVIRKDKYGFENFDDYWSESEADSILNDTSHVSNRTRGTKEEISCKEEATSKIQHQPRKNTVNPFEWMKNENLGRRTGKDILGSKVIRKDEFGFENFDDYWSESDADSIQTDASCISKGSQRKSCQEEETSELEVGMEAGNSSDLRQVKEQADALVKSSRDEVETKKSLTDDSQMSMKSQDNQNLSQDSQGYSVASSQESVVVNTVKKRSSSKLSIIHEGVTKESQASQLINEPRTAAKSVSASPLKDSISQTYQPLIEASKKIPLEYSTDSAISIMGLPHIDLHHKETSSAQKLSRAPKLKSTSQKETLKSSLSVNELNSNGGGLTTKNCVVEDKTVHIVEVMSKPLSPKSSHKKYSVSKTNIRVNMTESVSTAPEFITVNVNKEQAKELKNSQNVTQRRSRTRSKCCNSADTRNKSVDKPNSGDGNSFLTTKTSSKQFGEQNKETVRTEVNKQSELLTASVPPSAEDTCSSQINGKEGVNEGSSQPIDVGGNTTGSITRIENPSILNSSVSFNKTRKRLSFNALEEQENSAAISMKARPPKRASDGQKLSAEEKFQLSMYTRKSVPSMYEDIAEESDTSETFLTLAAMSQKSQQIQTAPSVTLEDEFDIVEDEFVFRLSSDDESKSKGRNGIKNLPDKVKKSKPSKSAKTKDVVHGTATISKEISTDDLNNVDQVTHTKTDTSTRKKKVKNANVETDTFSKEVAKECFQQVEVNQVLNSVNNNDASVRSRKKSKRQAKNKRKTVDVEEVAEVTRTVSDGSYRNKSSISVKKLKSKRGRHIKNRTLNSENTVTDKNISSISEKLMTNAENNVHHSSKKGRLSTNNTEFQHDNQSTIRKRKVDPTMEKSDSLDKKQKAQSSPISDLITDKVASLDDIRTRKAEKLMITEHAPKKGRRKELVSKMKREKRMKKMQQKQPKSIKNNNVKRVKPMMSKAMSCLNAVDSACHMIGDPVQGSVNSTRLTISRQSFNTPVTSNADASLNDFPHSEVFKSGVSFQYRRSEVMHLSPDPDSEKPLEIEIKHTEGLTPCIIKDNAHRKSKGGRRVTINEIVQKLSSQKSSAKLETESASQYVTQDDSMSATMPNTPVHIFEITTSKTPEPLRSQLESKIIYPEPAPEGLRRSKRIRLKPLEWYKNERVILEITETDCKIIGVQPSKEAAYLKMEDEKRRKRRLKMLLKKQEKASNRRRSSTGTNLSVHTELPHNLQMSSSNDIPVLQVDTQQEQDLECLAPKSMYEFVGPNGDPATKDDPFVLAIMLDQPFFNMGTLILQPLAEKTEQLVTAYAVCFTIRKGKVCVKIHRTSTVMETGDKFFIPIGNVYSLKNLRSDSATLDFVVFKVNDAASTSVFTGTGTQDD
ncbi:hypothetical protein CHS0354_027653 [Potamilus streckersoni]|uniref:Mif2/CENP-C cupin domain-containing protein n=1 Tax=Potamilus streckersoni TaxID=2493646 RepID=A0AAE0T0F2_9BIVA|nr:hypothetical protein CHS0354_027653 [Potamilus streckersoni]